MVKYGHIIVENTFVSRIFLPSFVYNKLLLAFFHLLDTWPDKKSTRWNSNLPPDF